MANPLMLGDIRVDIVRDGLFALDGGAMFGVVPRALWSQAMPADERNRITLALNCLLIRTGGDVVLVDTGIGHRWSEKEREIYAIRNRPGLVEALAGLGVGAEDVTKVVNTHLHFDHAGGNTTGENGLWRPTFPRARYYVQRGELEWALKPTLRDRASYVREAFVPLRELGRFTLLDGEEAIAGGVRVQRLPGHTPNLQGVIVEGGGRTLLFPSDLVPTASHLPFAWIMGYDLEPLVTLETKITTMRLAAERGWICVFQHEVLNPVGTVRIVGGRPVLDPLPDIG